jgi:hypothetical protein
MDSLEDAPGIGLSVPSYKRVMLKNHFPFALFQVFAFDLALQKELAPLFYHLHPAGNTSAVITI